MERGQTFSEQMAFSKPGPPLEPRHVKKKWSARLFFFLMERQNKTKIRQHLAFQYGIYAVKRGIYPFVTPESSSDMRAWAGADVTHKPWGEGREEEGGRGSQVPACRRHFLNSGVVLMDGRKHEIREAVVAHRHTKWYCLHLITLWPIPESVSLLGWALWVISRHAHWTEIKGQKKKKKKQGTSEEKNRRNSTHRA